MTERNMRKIAWFGLNWINLHWWKRCFLIAFHVVFKKRELISGSRLNNSIQQWCGAISPFLQGHDWTTFISAEVNCTLEQNNPICLHFINHFPHLFQSNFIFYILNVHIFIRLLIVNLANWRLHKIHIKIVKQKPQNTKL